jgi:hypothetical protein
MHKCNHRVCAELECQRTCSRVCKSWGGVGGSLVDKHWHPTNGGHTVNKEKAPAAMHSDNVSAYMEKCFDDTASESAPHGRAL